MPRISSGFKYLSKAQFVLSLWYQKIFQSNDMIIASHLYFVYSLTKKKSKWKKSNLDFSAHSKYDLYSKSKVRIDVEKVKPYYLSLIEKVSII